MVKNEQLQNQLTKFRDKQYTGVLIFIGFKEPFYEDSCSKTDARFEND